MLWDAKNEVTLWNLEPWQVCLTEVWTMEKMELVPEMLPSTLFFTQVVILIVTAVHMLFPGRSASAQFCLFL